MTDNIIDNKKEKDIAVSMFQNEHNRWNQWTLFFFGCLAAIFVFYGQVDKSIPLWIHCYGACFVSFLWVMVSLSIRESTHAWFQTIEELDNNSNKTAFILFKEKKKNFSRLSDFKTTMRIWTSEPYMRVTRMLTLLGVLLFIFFFLTGTINLLKGDITKHKDNKNINAASQETKEKMSNKSVQ